MVRHLNLDKLESFYVSISAHSVLSVTLQLLVAMCQLASRLSYLKQRR